MSHFAQIIALLLVVLGMGMLYQSIATRIDDARYPPLGQLVDIGTHKLHLYTTGKGGPVVILDAGLSGTSLGFCLVQNEVSKFTQVCSYDRAGYAWSGESPSKGTSKVLAKELHTLLHNAKIAGPYILVGHSFGGANVLMFAHLYPEETFGVILVDSVHEEMGSLPSQGYFGRMRDSFLASIGYQRFKGPPNEIKAMFGPLPKEIQEMYFAQMNKSGYRKTVSKELSDFNESLLQLKESHIHLQNKPLIVISAGIVLQDVEGEKWKALQKKHLLKSNQSKQVIAENSDHMINHYQPDVIIEAIREMMRN